MISEKDRLTRRAMLTWHLVLVLNERFIGALGVIEKEHAGEKSCIGSSRCWKQMLNKDTIGKDGLSCATAELQNRYTAVRGKRWNILSSFSPSLRHH